MTARDVCLMILILCVFVISTISIIMWMRADQRAEKLEREVIIGKLAINALGRYMKLMGCEIPTFDSEDLDSCVKATMEEASA